jgi:hypothetical protein
VWDSIKNKDLNPFNVSWGSSKKVWWICSNCDFGWNCSICDRNSKNKLRCTNCPRCAKSKGEIETENILVRYETNYISQYRFKDCKYKRPTPFDFYLPEHNCCIEYNGVQHYKPSDFSYNHKNVEESKKTFEIQVENDNIKRDYCLKNNIELIEIPYWDFDNIEQILVEKLSLTKK